MNEAKLLEADAPFLHLLPGGVEHAYNLAERLSTNLLQKTVARIVRGQKMPDKASLFNEFAAALQFPSYFGENWDAFEECLKDLSWLPADGYLIVVPCAEVLLKDEPPELPTLISVVKNTAREWAGQGVAFHVVLHCESKGEGALRAKLRAGGLSDAEME